jgi:hypothetical protein
LNDVCIDFLQCFSKYVYKTLNEVYRFHPVFQ